MRENNNALRIVCAGGYAAARAGPIGVHSNPRARGQLVCVGAEVIALGLDQIGRQTLRTGAIRTSIQNCITIEIHDIATKKRLQSKIKIDGVTERRLTGSHQRRPARY